jgi:hypothetical protein
MLHALWLEFASHTPRYFQFVHLEQSRIANRLDFWSSGRHVARLAQVIWQIKVLTSAPKE